MTAIIATETTRTLHIMLHGESKDLTFDALDIGDASTDEQIKEAIAVEFEFPTSKLRFHVVERHGENITVRPDAEFG